MDGAPKITYDFLMGQLRIAMVAVLAYGSGKGWFTTADATMLTAVATGLGPIIVPWAWSIYRNLGMKIVPSNSIAIEAAAVANKESAVKSGVAMIPADSAKVVGCLLAALLLSVLLVSPASAQIKKPQFTGDLAADTKANLGINPNTSAGGLKLTGSAPADIMAFLDGKFLPDLQYALKLATASNNTVTAPCYQAWIDIINTRQNAVKGEDGNPLPVPDPHLISDFERLVELRNSLQPESQFMLKCSPVASMVKLDIAKFMGLVISGGAGLAAMVPGL